MDGIEDLEQMMQDSELDSDMRAMAEEEFHDTKKNLPDLEKELNNYPKIAANAAKDAKAQQLAESYKNGEIDVNPTGAIGNLPTPEKFAQVGIE